MNEDEDTLSSSLRQYLASVIEIVKKTRQKHGNKYVNGEMWHRRPSRSFLLQGTATFPKPVDLLYPDVLLLFPHYFGLELTCVSSDGCTGSMAPSCTLLCHADVDHILIGGC